MFFTHQLNWLAPLSPVPPPHIPLTPLYGVLHVTLGFKQRAERGQWRIACGSGWLSASKQQRWVFSKKKGLFPSITACILWKVHTKYTASLPPIGAGRAFSFDALCLTNCRSAAKTYYFNLISFQFLHHTPWNLMLPEKVLWQLSAFFSWAVGLTSWTSLVSRQRPLWLLDPGISKSFPLYPLSPTGFLDYRKISKQK